MLQQNHKQTQFFSEMQYVPICYLEKNSTSNIFILLTLGAFTLLTSRLLKSRHFDPTIYTFFFFFFFFFWLVGSAHVRSQATVHAFMHAAHAVCMRAEDIDTRFKERA